MPNRSSKNKKEYGTFIVLALFSFLYVFFNSKNSPLYLFNEWGDVNIYFSVGKGMMNGLIPYKDLFDHKGPFIFLIYGIGYLISNDSFLGIYIIESLFLIGNIWFAYKLARLFVSKPFAYITAIIYALLIFNKSYYGGSAEEFISLFVTISFYFFIKYFKNSETQSDKETYIQMYMHGIMFTLTFLSKLSVCIFWVPLIIVILINQIGCKKYKQVLISNLSFLLGCVLTLIPFIAYFAINDSLQDAYFGYIKFNSIYAELSWDLDTLKKICGHFVKMLTTDYISFSLILIGLLFVLLSKKYRTKSMYGIAIVVSFILSFILISASKYIMTYAHVFLYVYAIIGVIALLRIAEKLIKNDRLLIWILYPSATIIVLIGGILQKNLFDENIECLLRTQECSYMQKEFAEIINQDRNNPTLLDLGLDHGIYTKANLIPAYKYFFYPNIGYHLFPDIRDYQENLIKQKKPTYIILGDKTSYFDYYSKLPELQDNYKIISTYYQKAGAFDNEVHLYKRK